MAEMVATAPPAPKGLLDSIPGLRQAALLAGVAAAVAAAIWLVLWSQGQNYSVLYGHLSERESGQVMDALTAAGIEYKLNPSGAVLVPDTKVQEARIKLATQGLPQGDAVGMETYQKDSSFGASSNAETARYQSALETEIARTIIKVQGVQTARVHLAMPKSSVFLRDSHKATASVMLQLYPGRRLEPGQVAAIVHLVASSVPELAPTDVTLVDQDGTLLNSPDENSPTAVSTREFDYTRKLEETYRKRIVELLEPIVGMGRVRATVTADLDFTVAEEATENYDPNKTAVRNEQTANDMHKAGDATEGIPGALSNQPPGTSGAPAIPGAAGTPQSSAAASAPTSTSNRATRNFEIDHKIRHVIEPTGTLKRLSVGVVLDDWQKVDAKGKVTTASMTENDLKRFTQLVRESIGIKEDRGDQLNLLNQAFKGEPAIAPLEAVPLWQQPWVLQLAKQGAGGLLALIVAFVVLRPLMKSLTKPATVGTQAEAAALAAEDKLSLSAAAMEDSPIKLAPSFEQQVAAARSLVIQDPKRAAQVVREWVATDG